MSRSYVLCSQFRSPLFLTQAKVVAVYERRNDAKDEAKRLNTSKRTRNEYWVESVPFIKPPTGDHR